MQTIVRIILILLVSGCVSTQAQTPGSTPAPGATATSSSTPAQSPSPTPSASSPMPSSTPTPSPARRAARKSETKHVDSKAFQTLMLKIRKKKNLTPRVIALLGQIEKSLASLHGEYQKLTDAEVRLSDEYVASLDVEAVAMQNLVNKQPDEATLFTTLSYVHEDLGLKLAHITKTPAQKETRQGFKTQVYYNGQTRTYALVPYYYTVYVMAAVTVTVSTKQGAKDIPGYEVWYVEKGLGDYPTYFQRFDGLSSPTARTLAPGAYFVWTKKGTVEGGREPLSVGGQGFTQTYEISVP